MTRTQQTTKGETMTHLYRACNGYAGQWSCWTPDRNIAEMYRNNPGYGGSQIAETVADGRVLDIRGPDGRQQLADEIAEHLRVDPADLSQDWIASGYGWCYEVWENSRAVREILEEQYDWVCHTEETYPEEAETWVRLATD